MGRTCVEASGVSDLFYYFPSGTKHCINGLSCLTSLSTKVEQIAAVFTAATRQKAWDHFSKAQRKNIDIWRKQCEVGTLLPSLTP